MRAFLLFHWDTHWLLLPMKLTNMNNMSLIKLKKQIEKIEKELSTCRTSVLQDGWQTQRHAKKARKWDILAQRKMEILSQIDEIEYSQSLIDKNHFV